MGTETSWGDEKSGGYAGCTILQMYLVPLNQTLVEDFKITVMLCPPYCSNKEKKPALTKPTLRSLFIIRPGTEAKRQGLSAARQGEGLHTASLGTWGPSLAWTGVLLGLSQSSTAWSRPPGHWSGAAHTPSPPRPPLRPPPWPPPRQPQRTAQEDGARCFPYLAQWLSSPRTLRWVHNL